MQIEEITMRARKYAYNFALDKAQLRDLKVDVLEDTVNRALCQLQATVYEHELAEETVSHVHYTTHHTSWWQRFKSEVGLGFWTKIGRPPVVVRHRHLVHVSISHALKFPDWEHRFYPREFGNAIMVQRWATRTGKSEVE